MEKVKWTDKLANKEVISWDNESRGLMAYIKNKETRWIGYILSHENLLKFALEGGMEGKRPRGRMRRKMFNGIMEEGFVTLKKKADDRRRWKHLI